MSNDTPLPFKASPTKQEFFKATGKTQYGTELTLGDIGRGFKSLFGAAEEVRNKSGGFGPKDFQQADLPGARPTKQEVEKKPATKKPQAAASKPVAYPTPAPTQEIPPAEANQMNRNVTLGSATKETFSINNFRGEVVGSDNVLPTHSYLITFAPFRYGYSENRELTNFVVNRREILMMRCDNVMLPSPALLQEETVRRYGYGPVEKMPYGVQFTDLSITWLVDKNSEIIDFMYQWMNTIVMHDAYNTNISQQLDFRRGLENYLPFEVGYKDSYANPIVRIYAYDRQLQTSTEYEMYDVFPMNIQSQNLSWAEENQVQKLTVNFAYTNMKMKAPKKIAYENEMMAREIIVNKKWLEEKYTDNLLTDTRGRDFKKSFNDSFNVSVNSSLPQFSTGTTPGGLLDIKTSITSEPTPTTLIPIKSTTGTAL